MCIAIYAHMGSPSSEECFFHKCKNKPDAQAAGADPDPLSP